MTSTANLLVVDDDEANRDMLSRRLRRAGYTVCLASSGPDALAAVDTGDVDLVLLDVQMPEMSGLDVLRVLRQQAHTQRMPVIMVTANSQSQDVVQALDLGANDYITKPVDLPVALARIRTHLLQRRSELALGESEERYALAVRGANDGIWDWKIDTGQVYYSARWKNIVGYEEQEARHSLDDWLHRVHPDDVPGLRTALDDHVRGRTPHLEFEHRVRGHNQAYRWVLARGVAVRDEQGRAVRIAGSLTDITAGKVADALSGLPNRVLFLDRVDRLLEQQKRSGGPSFAVLFLDIDRFKVVNDSLGHIAGDELLVLTARRLEGCLRASDTVARLEGPRADRAQSNPATVARLGGDEFAVLITGLSDPTDVLSVASRIHQWMAAPFVLGVRQVFVTVSIGIAVSGSSYANASDLLRDADTAMYRAKATGPARTELFDTAMREQAIAQLELETDLRRALDRDEFDLYYQPIFSIDHGRVRSLEALIRWRHPSRGLVLPGVFISLLESTGLIERVGFWAVQRACNDLKAIEARHPHLSELTVAINLSARQIMLPALVDEMARIVTESGVPTERITFEITESSVMSNPEVAQATLEQLKAQGFRLAIDDFGTGYSSLSYLQRFPVDTLKIDRSFLKDHTTDTSSEAIVRTIVDLATHLGLDVVAEGIETEAQLGRLKAARCGYGQGFLFSRPVTRAQLDRVFDPANSDETSAA